MDWIRDVDFAWFGSDSLGYVGLFYVSLDNVPAFVRDVYTQDEYNCITNFVINDLPEYCESSAKKVWAEMESRKGLFVFEYDDNVGLYRKVGSPLDPVSINKFEGYNKLILNISSCDFSKDDKVSL